MRSNSLHVFLFFNVIRFDRNDISERFSRAAFSEISLLNPHIDETNNILTLQWSHKSSSGYLIVNSRSKAIVLCGSIELPVELVENIVDTFRTLLFPRLKIVLPCGSPKRSILKARNILDSSLIDNGFHILGEYSAFSPNDNNNSLPRIFLSGITIFVSDNWVFSMELSSDTENTAFALILSKAFVMIERLLEFSGQ